MKNLNLIGFLLFVSSVSFADRLRLDDVYCTHSFRNQDPSLHITFEGDKDDEDFVKVTAKELMRSRYSYDPISATLYESEEQRSYESRSGSFNIGIDDFSLSISGPISENLSPSKPNGFVDFGNGIEWKLYCQKK